MKIKRLFILFPISIIFVFGLFFINISSANAVSYTTGCGETFTIGSCGSSCCYPYCCGWSKEGGCTATCCGCTCPECSCSGNWNEYNADKIEGGPNIQIRNCESVCGSASCCCSCGPCVEDCSAEEICKECGSWQKAVRSCTPTLWGRYVIPSCECNQSNIDTPSGPRYYDNSEYPTNTCDPEEGKDSNNIYLPVKLDWDDVKGWKDGWKDGNTCPKNCSESCPDDCYYPEECYEESQCVHSYVIRIEEETLDEDRATTTNYTEVLSKSEFEPPNSCFFQSNKTYTWHVKACCDDEGKSCGLESTWTFTANSAPEPYSPYDLDWNGSKIIEGIDKEKSSTLQWCKIEDSDTYRETIVGDEEVNRPLSYKVLLYYSKDDLCHEQLFFNGKCLPIILEPDKNVFSTEKLPPDELFDEESLLFTKETTYAWKIAACVTDDGQECTDYSQLWKFSTGDWDLKTNLVNPLNDRNTSIGLPVTLTWNSPGANSYNYKLYGVSSGKNQTTNITFDSPQLSLDTIYEWTVQSCYDYESKECEASWGGPWYFKTTGKPPILVSFLESDIPIPIDFEWQEVSGAKSYIFKIQGNGLNKEIPTKITTLSLNYPDLKQETTYSWQVKTCARTEGKVCGDYSNPQTFKTFKLSVPQISFPKNNESFFTYQKSQILDWDEAKGANFYQYEVNFTNVSTEETNQSCNTGNIIPKTITRNTNSVSLNLVCLGDYQWKIRSCMDENCQDTGDWSEEYNFSFIQKEEPKETKGLVPCGRIEDDPNTQWNEREACQIKHIFLLIRNLVDFVLWTIGPLMLGILVLGTGVMFYLSMKFQDSLFLTRIKLIWKTAGIGYGILLFSWTILNLFLGLLGFKIGIFGNWWQVGF